LNSYNDSVAIYPQSAINPLLRIYIAILKTSLNFKFIITEESEQTESFSGDLCSVVRFPVTTFSFYDFFLTFFIFFLIFQEN
jgi:hypothetical protein